MTRAAPADADGRPKRAQSDRANSGSGAVPRALGQMVEAIGSEDFAGAVLDTLRALAGVELCSVFARDDGQRVELIFAQGELASSPGFAFQASQSYMRGHWRSDRQLARLSRSSAGAPIIVRRRACDIADPAYRAACYDNAGVIDRLSILSPGRPCFFINGYRTAQRAPFDAVDVAQLESHAAVLLAALRQHLRVTTGSEVPIDLATLVGTLASQDCCLSMREAEVVAGLMLGRTQTQIAAAASLSVATIVTYRRRAYGKLDVNNRLELVALRQKLMKRADTSLFASH
jgi:DNA-binding CsgD family transcriptional regulator